MLDQNGLVLNDHLVRNIIPSQLYNCKAIFISFDATNKKQTRDIFFCCCLIEMASTIK